MKAVKDSIDPKNAEGVSMKTEKLSIDPKNAEGVSMKTEKLPIDPNPLAEKKNIENDGTNLNNKAGVQPLSDETRRKIVDLAKAGIRPCDIARRLLVRRPNLKFLSFLIRSS